MSAGNVSYDLKSAADEIARRGCALGRPLEIMDETSSTNDVAKRSAKLGAPHGSTWLAERQTAGRGRQGRTWSAERGEGLLFSVLVRVKCPPRRLPLLALAAGLAVRDAVVTVAPESNALVKWPNDVVVDHRKLAGILVESASSSSPEVAIVIGVGVNVHTRIFPPEITHRATSLTLHSHSPPDRAALLAEILAGLDRDLELVAARGLGVIHGRLSAADALRNRSIATDTGLQGEATGIDLEGRLCVKGDDGVIHRLVAGEVHLVGTAKTRESAS